MIIWQTLANEGCKLFLHSRTLVIVFSLQGLIVMADDGDSTSVPKTDDNPLMMRLIVRMLSGKWQNVKNMTTLELHERMEAAKKDPSTEKVVVLVR